MSKSPYKVTRTTNFIGTQTEEKQYLQRLTTAVVNGTEKSLSTFHRQATFTTTKLQNIKNTLRTEDISHKTLVEITLKLFTLQHIRLDSRSQKLRYSKEFLKLTEKYLHETTMTNKPKIQLSSQPLSQESTIYNFDTSDDKDDAEDPNEQSEDDDETTLDTGTVEEKASNLQQDEQSHEESLQIQTEKDLTDSDKELLIILENFDKEQNKSNPTQSDKTETEASHTDSPITHLIKKCQQLQDTRRPG